MLYWWIERKQQRADSELPIAPSGEGGGSASLPEAQNT
jgi:hypothetical protein